MHPFKLLGYKPREGADLCLRMIENGENITFHFSQVLYELYKTECRNLEKPRQHFEVNQVLEFSRGLVFRLHRDGDTETSTLEFLVPRELAPLRQSILNSIPKLFQNALPEDSLKQLAAFIKDDYTSLDTTKPRVEQKEI